MGVGASMPTTKQDVVLKLEGVDVAYGDVQVLWDVNFEVRQGEILVLVGANGAGKSTTLKTISALLTPLKGRITHDGEPIQALKPFEVLARGVAHVPEGRRLFGEMTVEENLVMGSLSSHARAERQRSLEWVYELFPRLKERRRQPAGTMSGGEQQMAAIGRGLMAKPKLLMFDEPSLGLSPLLTDHIFDLIKKVNAEGLTVLLVEQNVHHTLAMCDRAYVLENGSIVLTGSGQELLANPHVREAYLGV